MDRDEATRLLSGGEAGVKEWNDRRTRKEMVPSLSGANLAGADLVGADLVGADLSRTNLRGADLSGANLSRADLSRADLGKADFSEADLSVADLREADLREADLSVADLHEADFREADLSVADLREADLREADFSKAILSGANLSGANLSKANLSRANLSGANLSGVDLSEANLRGAFCVSTTLADVVLSEVKGLETVTHIGPSSIGIDTLFAATPAVPDVFLRGCGVPENLITYLPSLRAESLQFYSCFISYSHEDKSFARRVHDTLQGRGIRCWLDEKQLLPGDNIYAKVDEGVRLWDKVLLCASKHSLTSGWVDDEIKHAFAKEKQLYKERNKEVLSLIPLDLDGYIFKTWEHPKKNLVMERLVADFKGWSRDNEKFERTLEQVIRALRADDAAREPPPAPKLW